MSIISRIDADLLRALSSGTGGSSSSTINGQGKRTTFDNQGLNLRSGLESTAGIFQNSFLRLGDAIKVVSFAQTALEKFLDITEKMLVLAKSAGESGSTSADRSRLNRAYKSLVRDFRKILKEAEGKGVNLLDQNDVRRVLQTAGVNTAAATELVQIFEKLAGADDIFGYEKFRIESRFVGSQERRTVGAGTLTPRFSRGGGDGTFSSPQTTNYVDIDTWFFNNVTRGDGTFKSAVTLEGLVGETKFVDLNKNGVLDRITVSGSTNQYSVAMGNGDGTFLAEEIGGTLGATVTRTGFIIGDFNGDTFDDMVVANAAGNLEYLIGRGDGTFKYVQSFAVGTADLTNGATLIEKVDINNDGNLDIVVARSGASDDIAVLYGNGNGSFSAPVSFALASTATGPQSLVFADLNRDGVQDLIVGGQDTTAGVQVLIANTNGTFKAAVSYAGAFDSSSLMVGDIDNDGITDLVRLDSSGGSAVAYIRIGNGDGTLKAEVSYNTGLVAAGDALLGDYTGDGQLDILVAAPGAGTMRMLQGNGDGTFKASIFVGSGALNSTISLTQADLNRDGSLEIIQYSSAGMSVLMGNQGRILNGDGSFLAPVSVAITDFGGLEGKLVDINRDGNLDLVASSNSLYVALGNGDGSFKAVMSFGDPADALATEMIADFNGDGFLDVIANGGGANRILLGNGNGTFKAAQTIIGSSQILDFADYNGDGTLDFAFEGSSAASIQIALGNGNGTFKYGASIARPSAFPGNITSGDFNGDGVLDLNVNWGSDTTAILLGNGDGNFKAAVSYFSAGDQLYEGGTVFDLNGDGALDLLSVSGDGSAVLKVLIGNGDGSFKAYQSYVMPDAKVSAPVSFADVNSDGRIDVISGVLGETYVSVMLGNADGSFSLGATFETGTASLNASPQIGDINNDGAKDILNLRDTGEIQILFGNGALAPRTLASNVVAQESAPVDLQLLDANRDGKLDLITVHRNTNKVGVQLANGDGTFKAFVTYAVGVSPSSVSFTDTNSDGIADLVVTNQGGDNVSVLLGNGDGSFKVMTTTITTRDQVDRPWSYDPVTFGNGTFQAAITIPGIGNTSETLSADIDGDGILDLVAIRESVTIFLGNGDGSFRLSQTLATGGGVGSGNLSDVNRDGKVDLTIRTGGSGMITFFGNADGTFWSPVTSMGTLFGGLQIYGDYNNDGIRDFTLQVDNTTDARTWLGNADGTFRFGSTFTTGAWRPRAVSGAIGDVNGDGLNDLIIGSQYGTEGLKVSLGNGDGTFKAEVSYITGGGVGQGFWSLDLADLDNDGVLDIVGGTRDHRIVFSKGNGDGTFRAAVTYHSLASFIGRVEVVDVNGDGNPDLIASNNSNTQISLGNGDGTLRAGTTYAASGSRDAAILATGDFNGDGALDFITESDSTQKLILGNQQSRLVGDGTFKAAVSYNIPTNRDIVLEDMNGDGILDLIGAGDPFRVFVALGNGDGSFQARRSFSSGGSDLFMLASGDIDGDGISDIVVNLDDQNSLGVLFGNGDGTFRASVTYLLPTGSRGVLVGDLNGDGRAEIVGFGATATVISANGDGSFAWVSRMNSPSGFNGVFGGEIRDVNGDGITDLILVTQTGSDFGERAAVAIGNGDGTFLSPVLYHRYNGQRAVRAYGDVNNDGITDIVLGASTSPGTTVFLGNADGSFKFPLTFPDPINSTGYDSVRLVDITGDGNLDMISIVSGGDIFIRRGNGDGSFAAAVSITVSTSSFSLEIGDLNGDGVSDLVIGEYGGIARVLLGNGTAQAATAGVTTGESPVSVRLLDANRDGKLDLVTADRDSNTISVSFGNGDGSFKLRNVYQVGSSPSAIEFADIDGDGVLDLVATNEGGNTVSVLLGNRDGTFKTSFERRDTRDWSFVPVTGGDGSFSAPVSVATGFTSGESFAWDMNRDGATDVIVASAAGTDIQLRTGNTNGTFRNIILESAAGVVNDIAVGDFNGDGVSDIALATNGALELRFGNGDGSFRAKEIVATGNFTTVSGSDLNADGRLDLIYSDSSSFFTRIGNGDGSFKQERVYTDGAGITQHSVRDLTRDGRPEIVTSNTTSNTISVWRNNGDGTFAIGSSFSTDTALRDYKLVDLNNDGNLDLVGESASDGTLSVMLGNLGGSFTARVSFAGVTDLRNIQVTDLTNDGFLDLIVNDDPNNSVLVYSGNGDGSFKAAVSFAGVDAGAVVVGDFNGDGVADIVATGTTISVLRGNQATTLINDGTFKATTSFQTGTSPYNVISADVDGDGILDLVSTDIADDTINVMLGNGDGSFKARVSFTTGVSPFAVKAADLDGDGVVDLVVTDIDSESLSVFIGNGDGTFKTRLSLGTGANPYGVEIGDFDGDGINDIIATDAFSETVSVFVGCGDGTFKTRVSFDTVGGARTVSVGDFNGDGVLDLAMDTFPNSVNVLLGNGNATFRAAVSFETGDAPRFIASADLNGDGVYDLVTADFTSETLSILVGNGDGTFKARESLEIGGTTQSLALKDFNGDGVLDLITGDITANTVSVFFGNGDGSFKSRVSFATGSSPVSIALGDFNRDGTLDIATADFGLSAVGILLANGTTAPATRGGYAGENPIDVQLLDANRNGILDIVTANRTTNTVSIQIGNGDGTFQAAVSYATGVSPSAVAFRDLNGDGILDLAVTNEGGDNVAVLLGNGDGSFKVMTTTITVEGAETVDHYFDPVDDGVTTRLVGDGTFLSPISYAVNLGRDIEVGDFNGDGIVDLIGQGAATSVLVSLGNGDGSFKARVSFAVGGSDLFQTAVGDINNDGNLDVVITLEDQGRVGVLFGNGDGTLKAPTTIPAFGGVRSVELGDLNGDGKLDLLVITDRAVVFLGNGDGSFTPYSTVVAPPSTTIEVNSPYSSIVDVNGDGINDLIFTSTGAGAFDREKPLIAIGNGDGSFFAPVSYARFFGAQNSRAYGDVDGDGTIDIVTGLSTNGTGIFLNNGDGTYKAPIVLPDLDSTGTASEGVQLFDINGDGNLDIIGLGQTSEKVFIRFGNGDGTFASGVSFGTLTNIRALEVADVNGDGVFDLLAADYAGPVYVFLGNGTAQAATAGYSTTESPVSVQLLDVNRDGILDLVTADRDSNTVSVAFGNGDGSFKVRNVYSTGTSPSAIEFADINQDGVQDLVVTNEGGSNVSVLLGNRDGTFKTSFERRDTRDWSFTPVTGGDGSFSAPVSIAAGFTSGEAFVWDLNDDGRSDLLVASAAGTDIQLRTANADGSFRNINLESAAGVVNDIAVGDFNGDGVSDIALATNGALELRFGNGDGSFRAKQIVATGNFTTVSGSDLNADGRLDLIYSDSSSFFTRLGNGDGTFRNARSYTGGAGTTQHSVKDLTGDGRPEIVTSNTTSNTISVWRNNGDGTFAVGLSFSSGTALRDYQLTDLNNDGILDLVGESASDGTLSVMLGNLGGSFTARVSFAGVTDLRNIQVADVTNDGFRDLIVNDDTNNRVLVYSGNGDGSFKAAVSFAGVDAGGVVVGDFNGDGVADIVATGTTISVLRGNQQTTLQGNGTFKAPVTIGPNIAFSDAFFTDLDFDGIADLVVMASNTNMYVGLGNADGTFKALNSYFLSGSSELIEPKMGDFDNDGYLDFITGTHTGGGVAIAFGNGDGSFSSPLSINFGTLVRGVSVGDFNGDGNLDFFARDLGTLSGGVFLGNGDGTFNAKITAATYGYLSEAVDVNGDGALDLVLFGGTGVSVAIGNGDGTFEAVRTYTNGGFDTWYGTLADVNNDGIVDVIAAEESSDSVFLYLGNSDGSFKVATTILAGVNNLHGVTAADFNGDGRIDIALAALTNASTHLLTGNGDGTFAIASSTAAGNNARLIKAFDINRDGALDQFVIHDSTAGIQIQFGNGTTVAADRSYATNSTPVAIRLADLDRDGILDQITAEKGTNTVSVSRGNGDGTFNAIVSFYAGMGVEDVQYADVDGDGILDLVAANQGSDTVSVLFGNGDGTFSARISYAVGDGPMSLWVADVNRDGSFDIVTIDSAENRISVLIGNSDGTFNARISYQAPTGNGEKLFLADVNRDGTLDIVTANNTGNSVGVLIGNTDGSFNIATTFAAAGAVSDVVVADMNGDGRLDLVAAEAGSNRISVFYGNGNGTFQARQAYETAGTPNSLAVADLNRDGYMDVVATFEGSDQAGVFYGRPDGRLENAVTYTTGNGPGAIAIGDVNRDGQLDFVVANRIDSSTNVVLGNGVLPTTAGGFELTNTVFPTTLGDRRINGLEFGDLNGDGILDLISTQYSAGIVVRLGNGDGSFKRGTTFATIPAGAFIPGDPLIADVNGDGFNDVLFSRGGVAALAVHLGNGDGTLKAALSFQGLSSQSGTVKVGDFNSDGILDVAATANAAGSELRIFIGNGDGTFNAAINNFANQSAGFDIGDFNGDGVLDIVGKHGADTNIQLYTGNGDGTFKLSQINLGFGQADVRLGDINGDGNLDIVGLRGSATNNLFVLLGNGNGSFKSLVSYTAGVSVTKAFPDQEMFLRDFDGDGVLDVLAVHEDTFSIARGNGDGTFLAGQVFTSFAGIKNADTSVGVGDLNNDGILDIGVGLFSTQSGAIQIHLGNGTATSPQPNLYSTGDGAVDLRLADINRDGRMDLVTADSRANTVTVQFGNGDGSFATRLSFITGAAPSAIDLMDVNRDGILDIVTADSGSNTVSVLLGNANGTFKTRVSFQVGAAPGDVAFLDIDRDGRPDIVTANEADGTITVLYGNGNGTFKAALTYAVGAAPQQLAFADFNQDGVLDIAVTLKDDDRMAVLYGRDDGTFKAAVSYIAGNLPKGIAVGDLNNDGFVDVAGTSADWNQANIWMGNGTRSPEGTFEYYTGLTDLKHVSDRITALTSADVNGDGILDLVSAEYIEGVVVRIGNGDGTFKAGLSNPLWPGGFSQPKWSAPGRYERRWYPRLCGGETLRTRYWTW